MAAGAGVPVGLWRRARRPSCPNPTTPASRCSAAWTWASRCITPAHWTGRGSGCTTNGLNRPGWWRGS
ncbi:hypothetical protein ACFPM0_30285 [Pseudonocardia sulfidoxydans]|uniref:hypothetical protein n=1 Tax=Pseudonocardia sulfidoxydans TaxID=54011 RepID=UPI00361D856A